MTSQEIIQKLEEQKAEQLVLQAMCNDDAKLSGINQNIANIEKAIETEKFILKLKKHDWTYRYSDDPGKSRRGEQSEKEIRRLREENPEFQRIYDTFISLKK